MRQTSFHDRYAPNFRLVGRLAPGVTAGAAQRDVAAVATALGTARPDRYADHLREPARVLTLREALVGRTRAALLLLLGAVGFVLLIACANVANLLLTRAAARERELAIRAALGAGRGRVARQLVTESLAIAVVGGAAGILFAVGGADVLRATLPEDLVGAAEIGVDFRLLAFAGCITLLTAALSGLLPAVGATHLDLPTALRGRGTAHAARSRSRALGVLVISEYALALVLTVGAGLMMRSFVNLNSEDPGFDPAGVLSLRLSTPPAQYDGATSRRFWSELLERVGGLPGVESAGAIHLLPLGSGNWGHFLTIDGRPDPAGAPSRPIDWRVATPGYFETLRIPLVRGRLFTDRDREDAGLVVLINETAARRYFPDQHPVGQRVRTAFEGSGDWATIIGVVGDTKDQALAGPARPQMYRIHAQRPIGTMALMVRAEGEALRLASPIRETIRDLDPDVPVSDVQLLGRVVADSIAQPRLLTSLLLGFGAIALSLGAVGLYGVVAYGAARRTREFGVRIALGARVGEVLGLAVRGALRPVGVGGAIGLAGALALSRVLESQLYEVEPMDPVVYTAAAGVLALAALAAALKPAWRAARTDPIVALRAD